jgi:hypothetical protein
LSELTETDLANIQLRGGKMVPTVVDNDEAEEEAAAAETAV